MSNYCEVVVYAILPSSRTLKKERHLNVFRYLHKGIHKGYGQLLTFRIGLFDPFD